MLRIKTVKVTNNKNVLVQIPKLVVESLNLQKDDILEFYFDDKEVVIRKKGFVKDE